MHKKIKYPATFKRSDFIKESSEILDKKIEALLEAMTFDEKMGLLWGESEPEGRIKTGNAGYQYGVPRLGIPEMVMYDGPAGTTGIYESTGLPQASIMSCSWDEEAAYQYGSIAASEVAAMGGNYLLAPQADTIHTPHFLRNRDMKGEDSFLSSKLCAAEARGILSQNVVATVKHFGVANVRDNKEDKDKNVIVDEQTLHETYLRPFEETVKKGRAGSIMSAYNILNGEYSTANTYLNINTLRNMWGFKGSVMSDWGAVHQFTLDKGMDIEMPSGAYNDRERILKRVKRGQIKLELLDQAVRHVLNGIAEAGLLSLVKLDEDGTVMEDPGHKEPISMEWYYGEAVEKGLLDSNADKVQQIIRESIVLLKNNQDVFPISAEEAETTVLIGLGAAYPVCGELQERSFGRLERMVSVSDALTEFTGKKYQTEAGIDFCGEIIPEEVLFKNMECTENGIIREIGISGEDVAKAVVAFNPGGGGFEFFGMKQINEDGDEIDTGMGSYAKVLDADFPDNTKRQVAAIDKVINFTCGTVDGKIVKNFRNAPNGTAFTNGESYTWRTFLKAPESGEFVLKLECIGGSARFLIEIDGEWKEVAANKMRENTQWPWETIINTPEGMAIDSRNFHLEAGKVYPVIVYARQCIPNKDLQLRIAWSTPSYRQENYGRALKLAAKADKILFFAVNMEEAITMFERMVRSRREIDMIPEQQKLLLDVLKVKRPEAKIAVIVQSSNTIATGAWEDKVDGVITTYLPGQEGSRIIAEILLGITNPSGKLTQTWPKWNEDTPVTDSDEHYTQREGGYIENGERRIQLTEGIFFGYRYYDKYKKGVVYPFGHGLSYTEYKYSDLTIKPVGDTFEATLYVTNIGERAGDEIVQLYLGETEVPPYVQIAEKQLCGYKRVSNLKPGESRKIKIIVDPTMLCYWDSALPLVTREDGTKDKWHRATGKRKLMVGASSRDIRLTKTIDVQ